MNDNGNKRVAFFYFPAVGNGELSAGKTFFATTLQLEQQSFKIMWFKE